MSKSKAYNKIIVGDDIQHLLINDQKTNKYSLSKDPITIGKERLKIARKKTGCENIYFSISDTDPNLAVTFESWSSKKDHELYLSELTESGRLSDIYCIMCHIFCEDIMECVMFNV